MTEGRKSSDTSTLIMEEGGELQDLEKSHRLRLLGLLADVNGAKRITILYMHTIVEIYTGCVIYL